MHHTAALLLCCSLAAARMNIPPAGTASPAWGAIKGQVVLDGKPVPGPDLVVNRKNGGIRWVLVWLAPVKDFKNPDRTLPVHPSLKKQLEDLTITPASGRLVAIQEGTAVVFKNTTAAACRLRDEGGARGPNVDRVIPAGGQVKVKGWKARYLPCSYSAWAKGWVGVFKHPYYAVTDADGKFEIKNAPAGTWRLILWQERVGWVVLKNKDDVGKVIEVKDKGITDLGQILEGRKPFAEPRAAW